MGLIEIEGTAEGVAAGGEALRSECQIHGWDSLLEVGDAAQSLWDVRHSASPTIAANAPDHLRSIQFIEDSAVPVTALPLYLTELERILRDNGTDAVIFGHAGDGNVHVNPLVDFHDPRWRQRTRDILDRVADLVASLGGTLSGEHGDGRIRAPYLDRIWSDDAVEAFQLVKDTLDPNRTLNPGVILPLPDQDPFEGVGPDRGAPDGHGG